MSGNHSKDNVHTLRPLSVHLGLAMAEYELAGRQAGVPPERLAQMLLGIRKYQNHAYRRPVPDYDITWQAGQARILRHKGGVREAGLLLIPSLINRSAILDLLPDHSFMRFLNAQGHTASLLDWGEPRLDDAMENVDALIMQRLIPAIEHAAEKHGGPVDVLGYCMGGTLTAAAAFARPDLFRRIIFLASPWDFHAGDRRMLASVAAGSPAAFQVMAEKNYLPMNWIQSVFAAVNADRAAEKFAGFADMEVGSPQDELFVAVEDWLNDGVDLGCGIARSCISEWYGENRPARGTWRVNDRAVDLTALPHKCLIIASDRDRLVPPESSLAMERQLAGADILRPDCGHVGMMSGSGAKTKVWQPLVDWLSR